MVIKIKLINVTNEVIVVEEEASLGTSRIALFVSIKAIRVNNAKIIETINLQSNKIEMIFSVENKFPEIISRLPSKTIEIAEKMENAIVQRIIVGINYLMI